VSSCQTGAAIAHSGPRSFRRSRIAGSGLFETGAETMPVSRRYPSVTGTPCARSSCHGWRRRSRLQRRSLRENVSRGTFCTRRRNANAFLGAARIPDVRRGPQRAALGESIRLRRQLRLGRRYWGDGIWPAAMRFRGEADLDDPPLSGRRTAWLSWYRRAAGWRPAGRPSWRRADRVPPRFAERSA